MPHPVRATRSEFVPAALDATRWDQIEPLINALRARAVRAPGELERWLVDRSELEAACSEARANLYISMTCATDDAGKSKAYSDYIQEIPPKLTPAFFELDKRQVELDAQLKPNPARYAVLMRSTRADVELFRPENDGWCELPLTHNPHVQRGIGVADMASALRSGRPHRASGALAYHVLDVMQSIGEAAASGGVVKPASTCDRPAPLPLGVRQGEIGD